MRYRCVCAILLGAVIASTSALAHHGFSSVFDEKTVVTLKGKVTKVDWRNPHPYIYLNVVDEKGQIHGWSVEFSDLNKLNRVGLSRESMKPDDEITISAFAGKAGGSFGYLDTDSSLAATYARANYFARAMEVTLSTGKRIAVP